MLRCFFCGSTENVHSHYVFDGTLHKSTFNNADTGTIKRKNVCNECFFVGQPDMDVEHAQGLLAQKRQAHTNVN